MKNRFIEALVSGVVLACAVFFIAIPLNALAAGPNPIDLLSAGNFAIVSGTGITNTDSHTTVITGNIASSPITAAAMNTVFCSEIIGTIYGVNAAYVGSGSQACFSGNPPLANKTVADNAVADMITAYNNAALVIAPTPVVGLGSGNIGGLIITPGIYKWSTDVNVATSVTLSGGANDVWLFQIAGDLNVASEGSVSSGVKVILSGGALASNVFWQVGGGTGATLGTYSTFNGTILTAKQIIIQTGAVLNGRALAQTLVTLDANVISIAAVVAHSSSVGNYNTITVIKQIINDNGGTATSFPLFINGNAVTSGQSVMFAPGVYTVTETNSSSYKATFSGDCDAAGKIAHGGVDTHNDVCVIVNNDIGPVAIVPAVPPLIDVLKTASPLSLPGGPGDVNYTYTLRNIGTVPVTDIKLVGDTCSPIVLTSGDANGDSKLDVNETWVFSCSTMLSTTHTNTVVATGWANGISANDVASATVVVGAPIVPPLIHVVKQPSVFTLSAAGGAVTYTYTVTNPGTAPLSAVSITDDKCTGLPGRVVGHPGDLNNNNLLESNESWQFTCKTNITKTTVNTVTAIGSANGLIARDSAVATVVVADPKLPSTGLAPLGKNIFVGLAVLAGMLVISSAALFVISKKRKT